ncbi:hypothetical protein [Thermus sediminis]|uniref:hypothetical protein n=1 Tax=Thermus sediminis TaxID=1761908 RepID=UPI000E3E5D1E|nr:hypothetical protein [Thermus sediminis]
MEESLLEILSRYVSPRAAEGLLRRAVEQGRPSRPGDWARLVESVLWPELKRLLPFQEMPPELKAWVRELKGLAALEAGEEEDEEEELPLEAVGLEEADLRARLAQRLARLEGVVGVVVAGEGGREELFPGEPIPLDPFHLLLRRHGYRTFYAVLEENLVAFRALGKGYVGLLARKETNVGRLLNSLRRLVSAAEVEG